MKFLFNVSDRRPPIFLRGLWVLMILLQSFSLLIAQKTVRIIPEQGKSVPVTVSGKERTYFLLTKTSTIRLQIDGPGKLRVLSRLGLSHESSGLEQYSIKVLEDGKEVKTYTTITEKSTATLKNSATIPGKGRKFSLKVPDDSHTYEFLLENTKAADAVLNFSFLPARIKLKSTPIEPLSYDRVVTTLEKEKVFTYYVSSDKNTVRLRVIGPTKLRVTTRLNFDAKMKGGQKYTVGVFENDNILIRKPLLTTKALGTSYTEWKDIVPGKLNSFYLNIPSGEHVYKFILSETAGSSVSLRFSIPTKDLNNEQ